MSSHHVDINPIMEGLAGRTLPQSVKVGASVAIVAGVLGFGYGLATNPAWAWGAFLTGLFYSLGIAQGALMFSVVLTMTWGRWGRPLKRIAEAAAFYLPVGYVLMLVFLLLGNGLYPWNPNTFVMDTPIDLEPHGEWAIRSKPIWLSLGFFITRQVVGVGAMILLSLAYVRASLRPDLIQTQSYLRLKRPEWKAPGWWSRIAGNPGNIEDEVHKGQATQSTLGAILGMTYALVFSMMAFDLIMSLAPWWYTNMFGGWLFASSFWLGMCFIGVVGLLSREWLGLGDLVTKSVTHDLGKLIFAFCMFWAYTLFAQILPIWYANMPEETDFLLIRLKLDQWAWLSQTVGVLCFLTPFTVLASRGIKKMKWPFIAILSLIMTGLFLERTLLVMPSVYFEDTFPTLLFLLVSLPVGAGFVGAVALVTTWALTHLPPVPVSDPRLQPHPWDVHVHALAERGEHGGH